MTRLLGCLLLLFSFTSLFAQNPDSSYYRPDLVPENLYEITLKDGTKLKGRILRQDVNEAVIQTANLGEVTVRANQIQKIQQVGVGDTDATPNLFAHRLYFSPTALALEKGRWYFNQLYYVSDISYGVSDRVSLGAAFYTFLPFNAFTLKAKVTFLRTDRVGLAVHGNLYAAGGFGAFGTVGGLQFLSTFGSSQNNTTLGLGTFVSGGELASGGYVTVGIQRKVGKEISILSQNHLIVGSAVNAGMLSGGIRFSRKRHAFDAGLIAPIASGFFADNGIVLVLPIVAYQLRFGQ